MLMFPLQVCLLNIKDEPTVEACIAVCSARIICIAAVPGLKGRSVHTYSWTDVTECTDRQVVSDLEKNKSDDAMLKVFNEKFFPISLIYFSTKKKVIFVSF